MNVVYGVCVSTAVYARTLTHEGSMLEANMCAHTKLTVTYAISTYARRATVTTEDHTTARLFKI
jgi:hypothetical protein